MTTRAVLSLGSNLGDREAHLRRGISLLRPELVAVSAIVETPPWGDPDQPAYLNAIAIVAGPRPPAYWLDRCRALEVDAGRVRDPGRRFGPRTLDVDVIAVWSSPAIAADSAIAADPAGPAVSTGSDVSGSPGEPVIMDTDELTLPHPRAHLRSFVLGPWLTLEPDAVLPGHGRVADLVAHLAAQPALPEPARSEHTRSEHTQPDPAQSDPEDAR